MPKEPQFEISVLRRIDEVSAPQWDALACPQAAPPIDPFTTHRFLKALEDSLSVGGQTGWTARHILVRSEGQPIAAMPLYLKTHSQGEYVFDHGWANAYDRAGGQYYPKLLSAVPFTPATGRRFLTHPDHVETGRAALVRAMIGLAVENGLSSAHVTFCTQEEARTGEGLGLSHRVGQQFHWENGGYACFDDFLSQLSSRKRKAIRRERRSALDFGGKIHLLTGDQIRPEHWDAFWQFYQDTGARKWGAPYLTRAFFDEVQAHLRADTLLIMCERGGRFVAGALNFIGRETLFGRYWGAIEDHPFLHFETCYYQAIEFAIAKGLKRVEAGAQGEHKLARGYLPVQTHSLHWIADAGFRAAVDQFIDAERAAVDEDIEVLTSYGPFRREGVDPQ